MTTIYTFKAGYTKLGTASVPASGTPTISISDGSTLLISGVSMNIAPLAGEYRYSYTGTAGLDLVGLCHSSDSQIDQPDLFSYTSNFITTNLDAPISSRQPSGTDPWSTSLPASYGAGTAGNILGNVAEVSDIWAKNTGLLTGTNSIGLLLVTDIDARISSRMASGTVVVGTNNDKTGYTVSTVQDKTGYSLSNPQSFNLIGNISGTLTNVRNILNNISGSINSVVQGVTVTTNNDKSGYSLLSPQSVNIIGNISGTITNTINLLNQGQVTVSGTVVVGTNNDKAGYSLSNPQNFNLIGNISGTITNLPNIRGNGYASDIAPSQSLYLFFTSTLSGVPASILGSPSIAIRKSNSVNTFTNGITFIADLGGRIGLNSIKIDTSVDSVFYTGGSDFIVEIATGTVGGVFVGGTVVGDFSINNRTPLRPFVAGRMLDISATGSVQVNDKTGFSLSSPQNFNLVGNISGTITNVYNVISGSAGGAPTVQQIVNGVWDEQNSAHLITGSTGKNLSNASSAGDPWSTALPGAYGAGLAGNIVGNRLDVLVSSRQPSGTVVVAQNNDKTGYSLSSPQSFDLIGNISGTIINVRNVLNNISGSINSVVGLNPALLDVAVSSRQASGTVVVSQNNDKSGYSVTGLNPALLDVAVSSRMASGTVFVQDKTGFSLSSIQSFNLIGNISGTLTNVYNVISGSASSGPTVQQIVNGVWDEQNQAHLITGSMGSALNNAAQSTSGSSSLTAASIWAYGVRVLTTPLGTALQPPPTPAAVWVFRGDTLTWAITGLGSLANLSKLYFTVKQSVDDLDTESIIQIEKAAGLLYISQAPAPNPANGSLVVNDATLGNITITLLAVEMAKLDLITNMSYDIQIVRTVPPLVSTLQAGQFNVTGDATRATV